MSTIIALTNQKGGVGKTTTSCALAAGLTLKGKKVLMIDLDPQGNTGFSIGLELEGGNTVYEVLKGIVPIKEAIQHTDYCDAVTSNILLSSAELEFTGQKRETILAQAIAPVRDEYDYIVIDTPPALNILTVNAYVVANHLIIPMVPEILSLLGVAQLKETINSVKKNLNPNLNILGILLTKFNRRTILAREVNEMAQTIAAQIGTVVFDTKIRNSVCVAEAPAQGESLFEYSPRSNPSKDYMALIDEISESIGL